MEERFKINATETSRKLHPRFESIECIKLTFFKMCKHSSFWSGSSKWLQENFERYDCFGNQSISMVTMETKVSRWLPCRPKYLFDYHGNQNISMAVLEIDVTPKVTWRPTYLQGCHGNQNLSKPMNSEKYLHIQ